MPLLQLTSKRSGGGFLLIPWSPELDWLESEIKGWGQGVRRCHQDKRIAMRDLVVELGADIGVLVSGECGSIDRAEVQLAVARLENGWEAYDSPRITARPAEDWLQVGDTDEWSQILTPEELARLLPPTETDIRIDRLKARKG